MPNNNEIRKSTELTSSSSETGKTAAMSAFFNGYCDSAANHTEEVCGEEAKR